MITSESLEVVRSNEVNLGGSNAPEETEKICYRVTTTSLYNILRNM
jgi:hypothetical protein